jgi:hypothetical protein
MVVPWLCNTPLKTVLYAKAYTKLLVAAEQGLLLPIFSTYYTSFEVSLLIMYVLLSSVNIFLLV